MLGAIAGASIIGGGLLGYLANKDAQKLNAAERARMMELIDKVKQPNFDMSSLTPEEFQIVGTYVPQAIPLIEEQAPELVQQSQAALQGRQAQQSALQRLMEVGNAPTDIAQQAAVSDASRAAAIQNQGSMAALNEQQARQGQGGLGLAGALSQMQANNQTGAMTSQNAALDAYRNRLNALSQGAAIGNQLQGNENNLALNNSNIINSYNQRMAQMRQNNAIANTNMQNEAQMSNLNNRQSAADKNTSNANDFMKYNQGNQNQLKQQQYNNQMQKIGAYSGLSAQNQQANTQNAQSKANLYGGLSQGLAGGIQGYQANQQQNEMNDLYKQMMADYAKKRQQQ